MDSVVPPKHYQLSCRIHGLCLHEHERGCVFCSKTGETERAVSIMIKDLETLRDQAELADSASTLLTLIQERALLLTHVGNLQAERSEENRRNRSLIAKYIAKNEELEQELKQLRPLKETKVELQTALCDNSRLNARLDKIEEDLERVAEENRQLREGLAETEKELVAVTGKLRSAQRLGTSERSADLPKTKNNDQSMRVDVRQLALGGNSQDRKRNDAMG